MAHILKPTPLPEMCPGVPPQLEPLRAVSWVRFSTLGSGSAGVTSLLGRIAQIAAIAATAVLTPPVVAEGAVDFARDVRPILERSCFGCHGPEKQKSGYRLDRRRDAFKGGDSGDAAIIPHKGAESPLLRYVSGTDPDLQMPPKKSTTPPLSAQEIVTLSKWVEGGAVWPDEFSGETMEERTTHWSWQPLKEVAVPEGAESHPVDAFIAAKLTESGVSPAPPADRRTLIRRLYFDLHGLAPTPEEVDAFDNDPDAKAYEKLVDRLLTSPRYGERWARHWLDVIHFADTHGFEHDRIRDHAWRYRDYVIDALNADIPWTRFIQEQLAADVLFPEQPELTRALGFLGAGPFDQSAAETAPKMFEANDRDDLIAQTMAAFTSTTVTCARCHDHKFDPISQEDYYSVAAVFAGITKGDITYDVDPQVSVERARWQRIAAAADKGDSAVLLSEEVQALAREWEKTLAASADWEIVHPEEIVSSGGATIEREVDGALFSTGPRPDKETLTLTARTTTRRINAIRIELLADKRLPHGGPGRQDNGNLHLSEVEMMMEHTGQKVTFSGAVSDFDQADHPVTNAFDGKERTDWGIYPKVGESHAGVFALERPLELPPGTRLRFILKQSYGEGHVIGKLRVSVTSAEFDRAALLPPDLEAVLLLPREQRDEKQHLALAAYVARRHAQRQLSSLPAMAQVYGAGANVLRHGKPVRISEPRPIHVLKRGDLNLPAAAASPGALAAVTRLAARFSTGSPETEGMRRAALAEWLTHPENPLAWRSIVNRVWHYHFGRGIVDTPNDFGRMGGEPSHPELLDWLALKFRDGGGTLKQLHRVIVTSAAYQRSSGHGAVVDPGNRLLSQTNRRRLDAESVRDIILQTAGRLDLTMGGPSVMHFYLGPPVQETPTLDYQHFDWDKPGANRRSIYRLVYRNIADPFMTALDFPDAAQLAPARSFSASALQALALWNDDFLLRNCEHLALRVEKLSPDPRDRIDAVVSLTLLRKPTREERAEYLSFIERHGLAALCRVLFNSNEFLFIN